MSDILKLVSDDYSGVRAAVIDFVSELAGNGIAGAAAAPNINKNCLQLLFNPQ
jgi:hypothetical protein